MSNPFAPSDPLAPALGLLRAERHEEAIAALLKLRKKDRANPQIAFYLGVAEAQRGAVEAARTYLREAVKLRPAAAAYHQELGVICQLSGRFEEAHRAFDEALRLAPGSPHIVASKAATLRIEGRYDEAIALLEPFADDPPRDRRFALVFGGLAHRMGRARQAIELLESVEAESRAAARSRASIAFTLGHLRDRLGDYEDAFRDFQRANELYGVRFDADAMAKRVDDLIATWTVERFLELPRARSLGDRQRELPVFIVGMPRSGTSVTEQIIASHPRAFGAGELADLNRAVQEMEGLPRGFPPLTKLEHLSQGTVDRLARKYAGVLAKMERGAERVTDKMPQNFMHLGLIALLFPEARVLHTRRNPLDTCLSCFFQEFSPRLTFSFDLVSCGQYYVQYERVMDHWRMLYAGARAAGVPVPELTDVVYEELTESPGENARALIEATGLEWDEQCLEFHRTERVTRTASTEQVRRPMYRTSVGRHRHYEGLLDGLREVLGEERDQ